MAESGRPIYDLPVVSNEYDVLQFPVDQNNVAKRVYATDLADYFKNTVILENTIQNMDLSVSLTAGEIYGLVKAGQIVLFDSGFLESNSTVSCLFPIHRVEKNGNDYTAFVYVQNDIDDPVYEYAVDKFGNVNLIGESSGGGGEAVVNLPFVTPEDYGAVGDGVTDDTVAVQVAVNSGKNVLFLAKTYRCSNIVIATPITIVGHKETLIKVPDDVEIPSYSSFTENTLVFKVTSDNVAIRGIGFDGNYGHLKARTGYDINAKFSSYGIRVSNCSNIIIDNCIIDNVKDAGIQVTAGCSDITIENNTIGKKGATGSFNRGIQCVQSDPAHNSNYKIVNNFIYNCGEHGIVVYFGNDNNIISGNTVYDCGLVDTNPDGTTEFTQGAGIKLSGCSNSIVADNTIVDCCSYGILCAGDLVYAENVQVLGNHVAYNTVSPRNTGISSTADKTICSGNIVHGVKNSSYAYASGIMVSGVDAIVSDNNVYDCDTCVTMQADGGTLTGNVLVGEAKEVVICKKDKVISGNTITSASNKNGIGYTSANHTIISGNRFKGVLNGMIFRESANDVNIFGNVYEDIQRNIYWIAGTPTNSKVDFVPVT